MSEKKSTVKSNIKSNSNKKVKTTSTNNVNATKEFVTNFVNKTKRFGKKALANNVFSPIYKGVVEKIKDKK